MKGKLVALASILCIASLMASGANAGKPIKPPKPDNPGKTKTELIIFTGDLQGWAHVEGCCPNAGPNPLYTLTLPYGLVDDSDPANTVYPAGTYEDGYLFMNGWSFDGESGYLVQFWHCSDPVEDNCLCEGDDPPLVVPLTFEIICGTSVYDKKTRVLRVTCDDEPWWKDYNRDIDMGLVSFEILRVPSRYCTDDICTEPSP